MYKIGEFSILSKTTIKTLRYYEKEELLLPSYVDNQTGYRFYKTQQLSDLAKIIELRQIGVPIQDIRKVLKGKNVEEVLLKRKKDIEKSIIETEEQLSRINYILEGKDMDYEVVVKELPKEIIYYKEGVIKDFSEITKFILDSAEECRKTNPNIKCVEPDYCYINYLDEEFKKENMKIRYAQAVTTEGIPNETIKFEQLQPVKAACIYHKGIYNKLGDAYAFIMKWIEENGYEIAESPRERYIDGIWNKENVEEWLTEIQVPIKKK